MSDRRVALEALADDVATEDAVTDAFVAKSFSDQLVIVDVAEGKSMPASVRERLADADVRPAESVYGDEDGAASPVGPTEVGTRHHFVDVRTRGTHRTEVVE